ncbi:MAG: glycosyltransferase [Acidobacteria bacterium]|nr:glycosyltransferase [Acidobacteriota bacterium]
MEWLAFFLAPENPVFLYLERVFMKDPFQGIYQPNGFDRLLLIPYFALLVALALYGLHRYYLVYAYYRHRKNLPPQPTGSLHSLPRVTVQLPVYNERYVVQRLIDEVCRLEYPRERLEIQVLDDSTDETSELARLAVERYAALGHPIHYYYRHHRQGFKAGALAEGLRKASGEFIALFDADFLPPPDFLQKTLPYFQDPKVGMVQTRWNYINRSYSLLTQVEGILLDGHFVLEHGARSRSGCFFNFNGTAGIWRRRAIEEAGGWQHDTLTEDTDLSYRAQLQGWKFLYLPEMECFSELPVEVNAFKSQQARWAKGLIQTGRKLLPTLWRSPMPLRVKIEATFHLTANICYPLMSLMTALLLPAIIVRFYQGWFQMLYIDLPLLIACTCSVSTFYLTAQRELFSKDWMGSIKYMPLLMMAGIGLTINNSRAVLEALFGVRSEFVRTAKYNIEARHNRIANKKYRHRANWIAWMEILVGCYFLFALYYAASNEYYLTVPFLFLFVGGYVGAGLLSLFQGKWERVEASCSQRLALLFRPIVKAFQQP